MILGRSHIVTLTIYYYLELFSKIMLVNVEHHPDHLLHGGGPACVHGLAVAHAHLWLEGRADEVRITTGDYLFRFLDF